MEAAQHRSVNKRLRKGVTVTAATESAAAEANVNSSTLRVRRHRRRHRDGLRLFTIEAPTANIEHAIARGLLKPEDRAKAWSVVQACYAAQLTDAALDWLIDGGVIEKQQRADAAAILRGISAWLEQANR
jgi:hypothetical protein